MTCDLAGYIYILVFPNGKRYVGQTIRSVPKRVLDHWSETKRGSSFIVHRAMRKYGQENVSVENFFPVYGNQIDLDIAENNHIETLNTRTPYGYNLKGGGNHGTHSEETKAKLSAANKGKRGYWTGRHHSEETRAKISAARMGIPRSEESKAKIRGRPLSEEHKAKISASNKGKQGYWAGKFRTEETKAKVSAARTGVPRSEETVAKMRGRRRSEESRARMSAARKNYLLKHVNDGDKNNDLQ